MDPPISPLHVRQYPYWYDAWRQSHKSPDHGARLRHRSVERHVFANCYEVPRQPAQARKHSSSSSSSSAGQHSPVPQSSRQNDAVGSYRGAKQSVENKKQNPPSTCNDKDNKEVPEPIYAKPIDETKFLQSVRHNASNKSPALNIIPEFDPFAKGQTIDSWIKKVELCREICDWSERQTTFYAILKLSGSAKIWYQSLPVVINSWEDLKNKMLEAFPATQNYAELLTQMINVKAEPGDCLELYYHEKINLLHRCNIFGKEAVDCLVHGVNDKIIRFTAQAAQLTEPHLLLKFFKSLK